MHPAHLRTPLARPRHPLSTRPRSVWPRSWPAAPPGAPRWRPPSPASRGRTLSPRAAPSASSPSRRPPRPRRWPPAPRGCCGCCGCLPPHHPPDPRAARSERPRHRPRLLFSFFSGPAAPPACAAPDPPSAALARAWSRVCPSCIHVCPSRRRWVPARGQGADARAGSGVAQHKSCNAPESVAGSSVPSWSCTCMVRWCLHTCVDTPRTERGRCARGAGRGARQARVCVRVCVCGAHAQS